MPRGVYKRILETILLVSIMLVLISGPVLAAYSYYTTIQVQETGGNDYDYLPIIADIDNDYLVDNGYISITGLDTRILSGSTPLEHMVADNKTLFVVPSVGAYSTGNYKYTLGNSLLDDFPIIVGYSDNTSSGGYITISDDDTLDAGVGGMDDFEIELKGWVDTDNGTDNNLVDKNDTFRTYVSASGNITSELSSSLNLQVAASSDDCRKSWDGAAWVFSTVVDTIATGYSGAANFKIGGGMRFLDVDIPQGATINNAHLILHAYQDNANVVVNSKIRGEDADNAITFSNVGDYDGRVYTTAVVNWDGIPAWVGGTSYDSPDITTIVQEIVDRPGWSSDNAMVVFWDDHENLSTQAGATVRYADSFDDGDVPPGLYIECGVAVTVTGVSSGEHIVKTTANGTSMTLSVTNYTGTHQGNSPQSVDITGISVPPTSSDWILMQNNVMPYMEYYKHTVSDTLIAWYQPISMIIGTNLDDREGTDIGETGTAEEDGIITWGLNPVDLDITIDSLISSSQPAVLPAGAEEAPDIVPEGEIPITGGTVNTTKLQDNPLYPVVQVVSEYTNYNEEQIWFIGATLIIFIGMGIAVVKVPNHLLLGGTVGLVLSGFFRAMEIYQWWMVLIFVFIFLMSILMERKPVL